MRVMIVLVGALLVLTPLQVLHAAGPELVLVEPGADASLTENGLQVVFQVSGFNIVPSDVPLSEAGKRPEANRADEGHLHLMLDLQPVVVWAKEEPYQFANVAAGEHVLHVELVNNDHSPLTPPVVRTVKFRTGPPATMPNTGSSSDLSKVLLAAAGMLMMIGALVRRQFRAG